MAATIIRKTFENLDTRLTTTNALLELDKFALKMFNQLLYNQKFSGSLVVSFLLGFLDYYFLIIVVNTINIILLKTKFKLILGS